MNTATIPQTPTVSLVQHLCRFFRNLADRLDDGSPERPGPEDVRREYLQTARIALLDAEAELERYTHTVAMLRKRVVRLNGVD